ncbi:MAG: hypothetical protein Q8Q39_04180 [bacterium]|nr:hypothetical protein [bacterium]
MLTLHFITADAKQEIADIKSVKVHLASGLVKILPHHAPMIATVEPGKMYAMRNDGIKTYDITGRGLLKVEKDVVTVVS